MKRKPCFSIKNVSTNDRKARVKIPLGKGRHVEPVKHRTDGDIQIQCEVCVYYNRWTQILHLLSLSYYILYLCARTLNLMIIEIVIINHIIPKYKGTLITDGWGLLLF